MIIENENQTIILPDDIKKTLFPYWVKVLSKNYQSLVKKLSDQTEDKHLCLSCLSKDDIKNELFEIDMIADHIFHYSMTTKNTCLTNIAYDLGIVKHDLNMMLYDEILRKFSYMTYHNIELCQACVRLHKAI